MSQEDTGSTDDHETTDGRTDGGAADESTTGQFAEGASVTDRMNDAAVSNHVSLTVGVFVALGAAIVLAVFMSSAFTSGTSPGFGLTASVGFGLTIAPLLAVLTGTWAARNRGDGSGDVLPAAFGGVAGVFGLYVTHYVFGGALGVSTGTVSIGPLFGWAVGVGLVAGTTALLVDAIEGRSGRVDVDFSWRALVYPVGVFVAFGLGLIVALFAAGELAASSSGAFAGFPANPATVAPDRLVVFAAVLGLLAGVVPRVEESGPSRIGATLLGSGVGFVIAYLLVFGLAHVLESDAMSGEELQYGPIVGVAVGAALAGAIGAWVADNTGDASAS